MPLPTSPARASPGRRWTRSGSPWGCHARSIGITQSRPLRIDCGPSGGPIFNALGLLLSVAIYGGVRRDSITRELAAWSALGHSWILSMSLSPVPVVDGGTLLKWTLVARGRSEADADATVRRVARGLGLLAGIVGVGLIALQRRRLLGGLRSKWSAPTVLCASLQLP